MIQKSYDSTNALYLIPTPIGNLSDMTIRALETIKLVDVIFCEDTRETASLLQQFEIKKKLIASHEHNEIQNKLKLKEYLSQGNNVAIVTDRGTPIISDPGYVLATYAIQEGYSVIPLPGPTAFVPALIASGLPPAPFLFYGFLNAKRGKRMKELTSLKNYPMTLIFYESPHRVKDTLMDIIEVFGNREIALAREISKKFEEFYRGYVKEILELDIVLKGEFVLVVDGNHEQVINTTDQLVEQVKVMIENGISASMAIRQVAQLNHVSKNIVYQAYYHEE